MVKGLDLFRDHFAEYRDRYVLIGGTACDLAMTEVDEEFRLTKDLDIVLCVEALDVEFAQAFWGFIAAGGYQVQETSSGQKRFYRFQKPTNSEYPLMLELFSRVPDALETSDGSHLTPIPISEEVSSLSAILLNDDYYHWILGGKREAGGVTTIGPEHLIPLKAKAWMDLSDKKTAGQTVDSKSIRKHRNDIFRLFPLLDAEHPITTPSSIAKDMALFFLRMESEDVDLKNLGLPDIKLTEVMTRLKRIYPTG